MVGRTHGIHAEPTTFGAKLALWALQVRRDRERLGGPAPAIAVGKLSGAVGTYSNVDPAVEATCASGSACARCRPPRSCARDRHAEFALRLRLGRAPPSSRSPPRSATCSAPRSARPTEPFREGAQKGTSADAPQAQPGEVRAALGPGPGAARQPAGRPGERRPVARAGHLPLVGRARHPARLVAARLLPDAQVHRRRRGPARCSPTACWRTSTRSYGLVFSQPVLLALVESGLTRDDAYRITQRRPWPPASSAARSSEVLRDDPEVTGRARRRSGWRPAST